MICLFVTSYNKFLFASNLVYWFLGTSYFVYVDILDGEYGCSLFSDQSFIIVGECFLWVLMYTVVVLYHNDDYWLFVMLKV
jgi:hypothetical protein